MTRLARADSFVLVERPFVEWNVFMVLCVRTAKAETRERWRRWLSDVSLTIVARRSGMATRMYKDRKTMLWQGFNNIKP